MKRAYIFAILMLSSSYIISNTDDKLIEAIENSDPEALRDLLIPGYLMSLDSKNKYVKLAQEATNETYSQLHQFHFSDLGTCTKGLLYGALGSCFTFLGGSVLFNSRNVRRWKGQLGRFSFGFEGAEYQGEQGGLDDKIFMGSLFALAAYFSGKSIGTFHSVFTNYNRLKKHHDALTIEAMMQRLPAFDNGCFVPGSLN